MNGSEWRFGKEAGEAAMWNDERRTVEWMLRGAETVLVFLAMSCALFRAATRWRRPILQSKRLRRGAQFGDVPPVATSTGHWLDSDDPDGGAVPERTRRRRHID